MKWFTLLIVFALAAPAQADIIGKTFNTGQSEEVESQSNSLNILFEPCDFDTTKICGRVTEIILPDGSVLADDSIMPDGSVLQGSYMIESLIEEAPGQYRKGRVLAPDESLRDEKMKYYGFRVDENDDGTITAAGCILTLCPRKLVWSPIN